jgi:serpin B
MAIHKTSMFLLSCLIIGVTACNKGGVGPGKGKNLVLTATDQQKVTAGNAFTLKLFKNLDSANTASANLFVSPLSVSMAMGMVNNGSSGQTLAAINNTMDFTGFTPAQVNTFYNSLINQLPQLDPGTTLNIANSIWYNQTLSVLPQFLQTNTTAYNAKVQALDFTSQASVNTINNWVSSQTNGKITDIIDKISPNDMLYLINAIYFKSSWNEKFDASKTTKLPFYTTDNGTVQTNFMDGTIDFKRFDNTEADVFELPYTNSKYSMVIVMPAGGAPVKQLITNLDSTKWKTWMAGLNSVKVELKMPKFTFGYSTILNNNLSALGMGLAFSDAADFSGINATTKLQITAVNQKATIEVDENGTTATVVTSVGVGTTATPVPPPTVIDHPFIFAIREMSSGLILFTGVVNNPLVQ